MPVEWIKEPFFQVGLPVMLTFVAASWYQSKRMDDLRSDLTRQMSELRAEMVKRLDRLEAKLDNHSDRLSRLEERTGMVRDR